MKVTYTIAINTDDSPVIVEQRVTHIMTEFFNAVNEKPLPSGVMKITRQE